MSVVFVGTIVLLPLLEHLNNCSGKKKRNINFRTLLNSEHHCFLHENRDFKSPISSEGLFSARIPRFHKPKFSPKTSHSRTSAIRTAQFTFLELSNTVFQNTAEDENLIQKLEVY